MITLAMDMQLVKPEAGIRKEYSCFNFKFGYKVSFLNGMILVY